MNAVPLFKGVFQNIPVQSPYCTKTPCKSCSASYSSLFCEKNYICKIGTSDYMCAFKIYHKEVLPVSNDYYLYYMEVMFPFFKNVWEK